MTGKPNSPHHTTDEFEIRARQQTLQDTELERYNSLLKLCEQAKLQYLSKREYTARTEQRDNRIVTVLRETDASVKRRRRNERLAGFC